MNFYNRLVTAHPPTLAHRWLSFWLGLLLALGPFLHSHFGASHEQGFHVDGVHAVHAAHTPSPELHSMQAPDDESPALGVATSLTQSEDEGWPLLVLVLVLPLLPRLPVQTALWPRAPRAGRLRPCRRAGWPPPSLAPPLR